MNTRSWSSLASWTAPTTRSPSLSAITSKSVALPRVVGRDPLDHARPRCPAPARHRAASGGGEPDDASRPPPAPTNSLMGAPPDRPGEWALGGSAGISSTPSLIIRPSEVTTRDRAARGGRHRRDDRVVGGPRPRRPRRPASPVRCAAPVIAVAVLATQPGRGQQHQARVVGHLERHRGGPGRAGALQQDGAARVGEPLGDVGQLAGDQLAQPARRLQDRGQLGDLGLQRLPLPLQLEPVVPGQPAQRRVQDVLGLDRGQVEDRHQPLLGRGGVVAGRG